MSRAEEAALKAYPIVRTYNDYVGDYDDTNFVQRIAYEEGYMCAEKDLELTWEDMLQIRGIMAQMCVEPDDHPEWLLSDEAYYKEVLKRFNEQKNENKIRKSDL